MCLGLWGAKERLGLNIAKIAGRARDAVEVQWAFLGLASAAAVHFLLRVALGRSLGPDGLGEYTLAFSFYMMGTVFAGLGFGMAITKYVAEHRDRPALARAFVSQGLLGTIISGAVMGLAFALCAGLIARYFLHKPDLAGLIFLTSLSFPFIAVQKLAQGVLNGQRRMRDFAVLNILQNGSVFVMSMVLVFLFGMGVEGAVLGYVLPTIAIGALSLRYFWDEVEWRPELGSPMMRELLWFGTCVIVINSVALVNTQVNTMVAGRYLSEAEVAFYGVAFVVITGYLLIPQAIQRVTTPAAATMHGRHDAAGIRRMVVRTSIVSAAICTAMAAGIVLFGKAGIGLLFGGEYRPAYGPLLILLAGYAVFAPMAAVGGVLSSIGKVDIQMAAAVAMVMANVVLTMMLVPHYGLEGAAASTAVTVLAQTAVGLYLLKRYIFDAENAAPA